jgi:hypothetical protein
VEEADAEEAKLGATAMLAGLHIESNKLQQAAAAATEEAAAEEVEEVRSVLQGTAASPAAALGLLLRTP